MPHTPTHAYRERRVEPLRRGFSLIELVTVMVIIAILGGVAIASTSNTYQSRQRAATRQVASEFNYIRELAMSTGRATWAQVQPTTETILYYQTPAGSAINSGTAVAMTDPASGTTWSTVFGSATASQGYAGIDIGTFNASTTSQWLGFDYLGRPLDSTGALITSSVTITILAASGGFSNSANSVVISPDSGLITSNTP